MLKNIFGRSIEESMKWFPEKARTLIRNFDTVSFQEYGTYIAECLARLVEKRESWEHASKVKTADLAEWLRKEGWRRRREGESTKNESCVTQGNALRRLALMLDKIAVRYYSPKNGGRKP